MALTYLSPGGEAVTGIEEMLAIQEKAKQQEFQNQLALRKQAHEEQQAALDHEMRVAELKARTQERQETENDRQRAELRQRILQTHMPGDFFDPDTIKDINRLGMGGEFFDQGALKPTPPKPMGEALGAPTAGGPIPGMRLAGPIAPPTPGSYRFAGTAAERHADEVEKRQQAFAQLAADPNSQFSQLVKTNPIGAEALWRANMGSTPPPASLFAESKPIYTVDGREGKVYGPNGQPVTSVPANAEIVHRQYEPAQAAGAAALTNMAPEDHQALVDSLARTYALGDTEQFNAAMSRSGVATAALRAEAVARATHYDPDKGTFDAKTPPRFESLRQQYKANQASLTQQKEIMTSIDSFAATAARNSALYDAYAEKIKSIDTGYEKANILAYGAARQFGTADMQEAMKQMDLIRSTLLSEYVNLTTKQKASAGESSQFAKKAMEDILNPYSPVSVVQAGFKALGEESKNRQKEYQKKQDDLEHQFPPIGGWPSDSGTTKKRPRYNPATGQIEGF